MLEKKSRPFLSICVAIYNVSSYLNECLTSLSKIPYAEIEFLLVDDGSIDSSKKICDEFVSKDPRFKKITHDKNKSLIQARKTGIQNALGEYILFVDGDDKIIPEAIHKLIFELKKIKPDLLQFEVRCFGPSEFHPESFDNNFKIKNFSEELNPVNYRKQIFIWRTVPWNLFNKVYKKTVAEKCLSGIGNLRLTSGEDAVLTFLMAHIAKKISQISLPLYCYRIGSGISKGDVTFSKFNQQVKDLRLTNIISDSSKRIGLIEIDSLSLKHLNIALLELTISRYWKLPLRDKGKAFHLLTEENLNLFRFSLISLRLLLNYSSRLIFPRGSYIRYLLKKKLKYR